MSGSNCCFLTCIQVSQEAGQVVWYSHHLKNFQQFVVTYIVKDFSVINKAEIDVYFWNSLDFSMIQWMLAIRSDRVPEELWTEFHDIVQEAVIKTIPKKKKCQKAERLSGEALRIAEKRRESKGKGEKERYTHLNAESQKMARRYKKAFLRDQCK